ncbi:hypothetical protein [Cyanobium sp. ULC084]
MLIDPESARVLRIINLEYNPDSLSRSLQVQTSSSSGEGGNRSEPMCLKGPAVESIKLEHPDKNANAVAFGIAPQHAALESLVHPSSAELLPAEAPLVLFIWSKCRVVPVREEPG